MPTDRAKIIAPPPLIYLGMLGLGLLLEWFWPTQVLDRPLALAVGIVFLVLGVVGLTAAIRTLLRSQTTINPYKATTTIVREGLYRFSRNPIYLADVLLYVGLAFVFDTWWALGLIPLLIWTMTIGVIMQEEAYLTEKFGDDYLRYKQQVRRWL